MMVYLDNNATTKVDDETVKIMSDFHNVNYGNPNSLHKIGTLSHQPMREALDQVYSALNASDDADVIINSCASEGNNSVLMGIYYKYIRTGLKKRIISTLVEHPAVIKPLAFLESLGLDVIYLEPNEHGLIDTESLEKVLTDDTALVSIMWANNETGLVFPIKELCSLAHSKGALFHTDAVQAIGKLKVDVKDTNVDFLTLSAHKFHGPKGVGALYIKEGVSLPAYILGGDQMGGKRGGTVNVAGLVAMGYAIEKANAMLDYENSHVKDLRDKLEVAILKIKDAVIIGKNSPRTPNTCLVSFKGVEGEAMLWELNKNGICASTGSACSSEDLEANQTFKSMSIDSDLAHTGIRFSLSRFTTEEEIDYTIEVINKSIERLRSIGLYS